MFRCVCFSIPTLLPIPVPVFPTQKIFSGFPVSSLPDIFRVTLWFAMLTSLRLSPLRILKEKTLRTHWTREAFPKSRRSLGELSNFQSLSSFRHSTARIFTPTPSLFLIPFFLFYFPLLHISWCFLINCVPSLSLSLSSSASQGSKLKSR